MTDTRHLTCIYFGPIAEEGKPARGGFEAANRKNITALRSRGVKVEEVPDPVKARSVFGTAVYLKMLFTPFRLLRHAGRKNTVAHFTPLYGSVLYATAWGPLMARLLGIPSVVDIRAGSFTRIYQSKGRFYRWLTRRVLLSASIITVEGMPYIKEIGEIIGGKRPIKYFPNLIAAETEAKDAAAPRANRILYFGRITSNKGVKLILEAFRLLGKDYEFYLAGGVAPDIDISEFTSAGAVYLGSLNRGQLREQLAQARYFLFPSTHSGEGQSNSLIEAMGAGLIPISSDNGFSSDVVGDAGIILPKDATAADYAAAVRSIAESGRADELSAKAAARISEHHNLDKEIDSLISNYKEICRR